MDIDCSSLKDLVVNKVSWGNPRHVGIDWQNPLSPNGNNLVGIGYSQFVKGFSYNGEEFVLKNPTDGSDPQWIQTGTLYGTGDPPSYLDNCSIYVQYE